MLTLNGKLNGKKFILQRKEVKFTGHVLMPIGLKPDPGIKGQSSA